MVDSIEMKGGGLVDLALEQNINHWERWKKQNKWFIHVFQFLWSYGFPKENDKEKMKKRKRIGTQYIYIYIYIIKS